MNKRGHPRRRRIIPIDFGCEVSGQILAENFKHLEFEHKFLFSPNIQVRVVFCQQKNISGVCVRVNSDRIAKFGL
jgi:hypothetical protein